MDRSKRIIKVSVLGIVVNLILVVFKAIVGFVTNSIAIILDAVNNLSDALSSIITIIGTALSGKRPDKKHPYGYGRIEYFASVIIAVIVLLAGFVALKESFVKIIDPVKASYTTISLLIIMVAVLVKFVFGSYAKKQGENLNSGSLIASGADSMNDAFLSASTLVAAIISLIFGISLEGYLGVVISIIILKAAYEILKDPINDIIGVRADSGLTNKLKKTILSYDGVLGVFDLALHNYGPNKIIGTVHIQVKDDTNAREIHGLTRKITVDVFEKFGIILTIGIYASNDKRAYEDIQRYINKIIKNYETIIQTHGFYVDEKTNNISFDIIFSFEEMEPNKIVKEMVSLLQEKFPKYNYSVIIDADFSD